MAEYRGILRFTGSLDGKCFYKRNGKDVVQNKGGFEGTRIKTEERYLKTRQLYSEFGLCASQAALLKHDLQVFLDSIPDSYVYNWIQKRLVAVKSLDVVSERGKRTVLNGLKTKEGLAMWSSFQLNRNCSLGRVLNQRPVVCMDSGRVTFKGKGDLLGFVKSADYAAVQLVLLRVDFEAVSSEVCLSEGLMVPRDYELEEDLVLQAGVPGGSGVLMAFLSVRFFKRYGSDFDVLHVKENGLGVVGVVV
jgi:hypothetical protein